MPHYGPRRHQVLIASTALPAASAGVACPSPVVVHPPRARAPRIAPRIASIHTRIVIGSPILPPVTVAPQTRITLVRHSHRGYQPQVVMTSKDRAADVLRPSIAVGPVIRRARRPAAPAVVISTRPITAAIASPSRFVVAPRPRGRRPVAAIIARSATPLTPRQARPVVVRRLPAHRIFPATIARSATPLTPRQARPVIVVRNRPRRLITPLVEVTRYVPPTPPPKPIVVPARPPITVVRTFWQTRTPQVYSGAKARLPDVPRPIPIVVPVRQRKRLSPVELTRLGTTRPAPNAAIVRRLPLVVTVPANRHSRRAGLVVTTAVPLFSRPMAVPLIVPVPRHVRGPVRLIVPVPRHPLSSPAITGPMPRPIIVGQIKPRGPRSIARTYSSLYQTTIANPPQPIPIVNPPQPGQPTTPPDLVAACIAWLRLQPSIVAAFGDGLATQKFYSDVTVRGIDPPWLVFAEPSEERGRETRDQTGLTSSCSDGMLACEVVSGGGSNGKVINRQLAAAVAAVLNDAPLTFADGVLVYLYAAVDRYPSFREAGPGGNVQLYKRILEFDYKIERWAPAL